MVLFTEICLQYHYYDVSLQAAIQMTAQAGILTVRIIRPLDTTPLQCIKLPQLGYTAASTCSVTLKMTKDGW